MTKLSSYPQSYQQIEEYQQIDSINKLKTGGGILKHRGKSIYLLPIDMYQNKLNKNKKYSKKVLTNTVKYDIVETTKEIKRDKNSKNSIQTNQKYILPLAPIYRYIYIVYRSRWKKGKNTYK